MREESIMHNFYIITNPKKDPDRTITDSIVHYLESKGQSCCVREHDDRDPSGRYRYTDPDKIPADVECIIVLGGDGTMIRSAVDCIDRQIPILGINLGTLGYLAEIDRHSVLYALRHLINDEYMLEHRMMLEGTVWRGNDIIGQSIAMNDIVIRREDTGMIRLSNSVNGSYMNSYKADGMIISTPTGSTGYSLSVGGPIISPQASLFLMTPLAAHTLSSRSVIFPESDQITVTIGEGRDDESVNALALYDGDVKIETRTGDRIVIRRAKKDALVLKIHNDSFMETLRRKMSAL